MRIVFTADWHLGIDTHSTNRVGIPSRTQDSIDAIRRIFRKAEDLEANVLIVGGDLFHHPNPRPLFIHEAIGLLDDASHIFKYVLVIAGNHDPKPAGGKGPIGLLESCRIGKNLMFFEDNDWDILLNPVHFAIRPYLKKVNTLKDAEIQSSIMVAHHHFSGATVGTESFMLAGGVPELSGKMKNTDLILSGHIHKPQMVRIKGTPVLYPGSPTRFDFSDRADDKGFWLVEIGEDDSIEHDFVKIDNRRMVQLYRRGRS
jgi:DNA repair exonuclease SbcCD nuclease subunit